MASFPRVLSSKYSLSLFKKISNLWNSRNRFWRFIALSLTGLLIVISWWQAPIVNSEPIQNNQIRGVWMTNYGVSLSYYTTRLDEVVANIAEHGLNTIYPAVWNRGYTLYPSPVAEAVSGSLRDYRTSLPLIPFQDALSGIITQAHRQHLRIIPWFEYGLIVPKNHAIAKLHPQWLSKTQRGKTSLKENMVWLNPAHPQVQKFITDLIVDAVQRYPVDGIQLDDHFAIPVEFGYDNYTIQLYRRDHNGSPPPRNIKDPEWMAWRAQKLTQLMAKISRAVKAVKPDAIISLSPNPLDFAYNNYLQDWQRWVSLNLLDEVIVQVYRDDIRAIQNELNNQNLLNMRSRIPVAIGLYTGPFFSPKSLKHVSKEIAVVERTKYQGVVFFCWETTMWFFKNGSNQDLDQALRLFFH